MELERGPTRKEIMEMFEHGIITEEEKNFLLKDCLADSKSNSMKEYKGNGKSGPLEVKIDADIDQFLNSIENRP
jgi:hypothetical protein